MADVFRDVLDVAEKVTDFTSAKITYLETEVPTHVLIKSNFPKCLLYARWPYNYSKRKHIHPLDVCS